MSKPEAVEQSLVAIVPHSKVAGLVKQFLNQTGGGKAPPRKAGKDRRPGPTSGGRRDLRNQKHPRRHEEPRQQPSQDLLPLFNGYQLIGDSMLSRLGSYATPARPSFNKSLNANQLGLCVSGQTISQLLRLLKSRECPKLAKKAILMIGTNNFLKRVPLEDAQRAFTNLVEILKEQTEKLVVMTIPPIPKLIADQTYQSTWCKFNKCITDIPNSQNLFVYNCAPCFLNGDTVKSELFEKDQVHWNRAAMKIMSDQLKEVILLN